ncbi:MAG: glycosyltransferase [Candidatus Omnitrophota bacterium]
MASATPFFSVIIPTYNRQNFLRTAVESVLNQTFNDLELIIVDDGSTDNTMEFIKSVKDQRIVYLHQEHKGVSIARNFGVKSSRGKVICFLDSDDWFKGDKLEVAFDYIMKYPAISIFHTDEIWYRDNKHLNQKDYHKKPEGHVFEQSLKICCISPSTAIIKKEVFQDIGFFDENMPACEDYDFWLRASIKYQVKLIAYELTFKKGGHEDQLSKKYPAMDTFRIYSIDKLLRSGTLNDQQQRLAIEELKHKCTIYIKGAEKRNKTVEVQHYKNLMKKYD